MSLLTLFHANLVSAPLPAVLPRHAFAASMRVSDFTASPRVRDFIASPRQRDFTAGS